MGATVPQMGAAFPIVMQMGATDLCSHPDGGCVRNSFQMGATIPQMGATFSIVCRWGLRITVHTQMGGDFFCYADSIRSASSKYMQVDSFETDYSYEVFRS